MRCHGRTLRIAWLIFAFACAATAGCDAQPAAEDVDRQVSDAEAEQSDQPSNAFQIDIERPRHDRSGDSLNLGIRLVDEAATAGLEFVYDRGAEGKLLMSEATGGGVAWLDYDLDGWNDLFLVQGGNPVDESAAPSDELWRNAFGEKLTRIDESTAGVNEGRYGQGVTVADYDADGFPDLFVSNLGRNTLLRNQGDGTFEDVTDSAGVAGQYLWSTSAAWCDLDRDGLLDLFVCNYLKYDPKHPIPCFDINGNRATCDPMHIDPLPNECYLNRGDGTFAEVASERGLVGPGSKSLGVVAADFDGDLWPDLFVANDTTSNFFYRNLGHAQFEETAIASGCAMSGTGQNQASMGVAFGDYDRDLQFDLYVTHFSDDSNTLYRGLGGTLFEDATRSTMLHQPTLPYLGFGTVMTDLNQDGRDEIFVANGHIDDERFRGRMWKMPAQLFTFSDPDWREVSRDSGAYFDQQRLGRGIAMGDFDNDGAPDLAVANQDDPTALLRNRSTRGKWLALRFRGDRSPRQGQGVRVTVEVDGERQIQELAGGTSYCSASQPALFFGFGKLPGPCRLAIRWPSGVEQQFENVPLGQALLLDEAAGILPATPPPTNAGD